MTATPEQIAALQARGWTHDAEYGDFAARAPVGCGDYALSLRVRLRGEHWESDYGWTGVSFGNFRAKHPTPIEAADAAEAWLRGVLAGFRFPWLVVTP